MKSIFSIAIILITSKVFSQSISDSEDSLFIHLQKSKTNKELLKSFNKEWKNFNIEKSIIISVDRNLDFNFHQLIYEIRIHYKAYKGFRKYKIYTILKNDTIVLGLMESDIIDSKSYSIPKKYMQDSISINKYLRQHNIIYNTNFTINDFTDRFNKKIIYGFNCGEGNNNSKEALKTIQYISEKNQIELSKMLRDLNPEIQAFGFVGLLRLKKTGFKINVNDERLIKYLTKNKTKINHCSGCLYGLQTSFEEIKNE